MRCCLAISIGTADPWSVTIPFVIGDSPKSYSTEAPIDSNWFGIPENLPSTHLTPPQTNQASSISHKERCHKKEQRNKKTGLKGKFWVPLKGILAVVPQLLPHIALYNHYSNYQQVLYILKKKLSQKILSQILSEPTIFPKIKNARSHFVCKIWS